MIGLEWYPCCTLQPYKYSNILKFSHSSYLSAYEDGTEYSETSACKIQTPGIAQKKAYCKYNLFLFG